MVGRQQPFILFWLWRINLLEPYKINSMYQWKCRVGNSKGLLFYRNSENEQKNSQNELLGESWKVVKGYSHQANLESRKKDDLNVVGEQRGVLTYPHPTPFSSLVMVLKMASQSPSACLQFWREQSRPCYNCVFLFWPVWGLPEWLMQEHLPLSQRGKVAKLKTLEGKRTRYCYFHLKE